MKTQRKYTAEELEPYMLAEAVRRHYMSLEGGGDGVFEEALFFLQWHHSNAEGLKNYDAWAEASRRIKSQT